MGFELCESAYNTRPSKKCESGYFTTLCLGKQKGELVKFQNDSGTSCSVYINRRSVVTSDDELNQYRLEDHGDSI